MWRRNGSWERARGRLVGLSGKLGCDFVDDAGQGTGVVLAVRHTSASDSVRGVKPGEKLRGPSAQERQSTFWIEESDLESQRYGDGVSGSAAWRTHRGTVARCEAKVDLCRGRSAEALMGPKVSVVGEPLMNAALEVYAMTGLERDQSELRLQSQPQPLDERDGPCLADGAEALADGELLEPLSKQGGGELRPLVRDEVSGRSVAGGGLRDDIGDVLGGGLGREDAKGERQAREGVDDDRDLEGPDAEERRDRGEIGYPDVVRVAGSDGAARRPWLKRDDGRLLADSTDGTPRTRASSLRGLASGQWCGRPRILRSPWP